MSSTFYSAFEVKHRGSRELIKSRLRVYLPFIAPLKLIHPECKAVDLGCGRGEWLELLKEAGIDARGVDLDEGMLSACSELGLSIENKDALSFVQSLPDESQSIVSGFHIAEHLPFDDLQILVKEALRVLKPAGLLILETPNPENIRVATVNFYLDPTHQRPIPPLLLYFLSEHCGFCRTKVLRLQEPTGLAERNVIDLIEVIGGVSPDYAIIAQKSASDEQLANFNDVFEEEYGLTLEALTMRYDARIQETERRMQEAERRMQEAERKLDLIWRPLLPLRLLKRFVKKILKYIIVTPINILIKIRIFRILAFWFLRHFPKVKNRLSRYHSMQPALKAIMSPNHQLGNTLTQSAQDVLTELNILIKNKR